MSHTIERARRRIHLLLALLLACIGAATTPAARAQTVSPPTSQLAFSVYLPLVRSAERTGSAPNAPTIAAFTASAATITPGGEATLSWSVSGATAVRIEPGIGPVAGSSIVVKPTATTAYTLLATNGAGEARASVTVTVADGGDASNGANFIDRDRETGSPAIVTDTQGGSHLAYKATKPNTQNYILMYAFCPAPASACGDANRWQRIELPLEQVEQVQLLLTGSGHPRIVARARYAQDYHYHTYSYGACDTNCLQASAWSVTEVAFTNPDVEEELYSYLLPTHTFALDAQDRPRFTFANRFAFDTDNGRQYRKGGYYAQCDADCANEQSWSVERFTEMRLGEYEGWDYYDAILYPSLALTADGAPRIVAHLAYSVNADEPLGLYYFACDSSCDSDASWQRTKIADRGNGPHPVWRLALDANDRPHVAYYEEPDVATLETHRLFYLTCISDCARGGAWNNLDLQLPAGSGDGVDLALDREGRPRLAFVNAEHDLLYAWCNAGCHLAAGWQQATLEPRSRLDAEFAVPILPNCNGGFWNMRAVMLTLDAAGAPHIAYRGMFQERCYDVGPNPGDPPVLVFKNIWYAARVATFPQP